MHVRDSDGCTYQYTYDANNRMKRLEHCNGNRRVLTTYAYDRDGRETETVFAGYHRSSRYDSCGRLVSRNWEYVLDANTDHNAPDLTQANFNKLKQIYGYGQTESGKRLGTLPRTLQTGGGTFTYSYDGNGNITQIIRDGVLSSGNVVNQYHYDAANQLIREDDPNAIFRYYYDAGGNLTQIRKYAVAADGTPGALQETINATYRGTGWKDQLTNWNNKPITYNTNGCMTGKGDITYTWGPNQWLSTVKGTNNTVIAAYVYDHQGYRTRKTAGSTVTDYRWPWLTTATCTST